MLYIYLDTQQIKVLYLKKSLLGQYEASFYGVPFDVPLIVNGVPANVDVIDSAVKKVLQMIPENPLKDKEVTLIVPQDSFKYFRADLPVDITSTVLDSYISEKAKSLLGADSENYYSDFLIHESENQKKVTFYALSKDNAKAYEQPFSLLDLKLVNIIPESLAYFKLFEKTLRANKTENIWYVSYDNNRLLGYFFDSFGLLEEPAWYQSIGAEDKIATHLQKKAVEYQQAKNLKLNRLILSGKQSVGIRQDTFTKDVGVWTNPLFRIIPHFYADYIKLLQHQGPELPVVEYDVLVGAFIFSQENKNFGLFAQTKSVAAKMSQASTIVTEKKFPIKNIFMFLVSFIVTFGLLFFLSRMNWSKMSLSFPAFSMPKIPMLTKATPTPEPSPTPVAPTPTPKPEVDRTKVNIKILNGSGIAGKASVVKDFLNKKGYEEILTANADSFDYDTTVVQIKKDKEKVLKSVIAKDISSEVPKPKFETLDAGEAADIVIIVGTDFK